MASLLAAGYFLEDLFLMESIVLISISAHNLQNILNLIINIVNLHVIFPTVSETIIRNLTLT